MVSIPENVKAIIFTDFDGTISIQDSNDYLTDDLGMGVEKRKAIGKDILDLKTSFRDGFHEMLESVDTPFPECVDFLVKHIDLDPAFKTTFEWAQRENVPVIVISSGMYPIVEALLVKLLGEEAKKIEIVANHVDIDPKTNKWKIVYRDGSDFGHDKSKSIDVYKKYYADKGVERPTFFYCGDGVSDLSAAKETDLLFAKKGRDLITYCKRQNVPYTEFESFDDILSDVKSVLSGEKSIKDLMAN